MRDGAYPVVIIHKPLILLSHFVLFDLTNLLLIFLKIDAAQETNFEKDSSENAKVVVVSKTDHPSYNIGIIPVLMVDLILFLYGVQVIQVENLREGN